jgi:hypothetical protein
MLHNFHYETNFFKSQPYLIILYLIYKKIFLLLCYIYLLSFLSKRKWHQLKFWCCFDDQQFFFTYLTQFKVAMSLTIWLAFLWLKCPCKWIAKQLILSLGLVILRWFFFKLKLSWFLAYMVGNILESLNSYFCQCFTLAEVKCRCFPSFSYKLLSSFKYHENKII